MRLFDQILSPWRRKADPLQALLDLYGQFRLSGAGKPVSWQTALQVSTAFACARVIADGIAQVPLKLMRESGKTRLPATDHPLYSLLGRAPSQFQTSYEFRETMGFHLVFTGGAYAFINRVRGEIRELILLDPSGMTVTRESDGALTYTYRTPDGKTQVFPAEMIWHIRGPSWNSWIGLDCVHIARESLGLSIAIEESQAKQHANGSKVGGLLSVEGSLGEGQYQQLRTWLDKEHAGSWNAGRDMIMDRAAKWQSMAMTAVDAQLLETRRFQIEEICRHFRVMPIMVGYSDKASTYASAEQMFLSHIVNTLSPWYTRLEQSIEKNLLTDQERRDGYYANFVEEGMIRGSMTETKDMVLGLVNGGIITANEGREFYDLNPDSDLKSDQLRIPANIVGDPPGGAAK